MKRIVQVGEHEYVLPPLPDKSEILYSDHKKEDQYWRRDVTSFPKFFFDYNRKTKVNKEKTSYNNGLLVTLSVKDTKELIRLRDREMYRRTYGIWFMNNGEPVYLTGSYYFILQWCAMHDVKNPLDGSEYGGFRRIQLLLAYFMDLCINDSDCLGGYILKSKKNGTTQFIAGHYLEEATRFMQKRFGMMSTDKLKCRDTNMMYFKFGLDRLPYIMTPDTETNNQTRVKFAKGSRRTSKTDDAIREQLNENKGFETEVVAAPTVANYFDGPKMFRVWLDEFQKYMDPYPDDVFTKTQETVKQQTLINGKMWLSAYNPEVDGKNIEEAGIIWKDSKLHTKDKNTGRTKSGLYTFFMPADESFEGKFDKYGNTTKEDNRKVIYAYRTQYENDSKRLQGYIREYPLTEEEAWRTGGGHSTFDNLRLAMRLRDITDLFNTGALPFIEGFFRWKDGIRLGLVEFVPITPLQRDSTKQGIFRIYKNEWLPGNLHLDYNVSRRKNIVDGRGRLKPAPDSMFVGAMDTTDYVEKKEVRKGSNNAITNMILPDIKINTAFDAMVTDRLVLEYLHRHEDPNDTYEDFAMSTLFFSGHVYVESNKPWVITKAKNDELHNFILFRTKEKTIVPFNEFEHQYLTSTVRAGSLDVINDMCREINAYLKRPKLPDDYDMMDAIYSERLIGQLMKFDPLEHKQYDLAMCFGMNILAKLGVLLHRLKHANANNNYSEDIVNIMFKKLVLGS